MAGTTAGTMVATMPATTLEKGRVGRPKGRGGGGVPDRGHGGGGGGVNNGGSGGCILQGAFGCYSEDIFMRYNFLCLGELARSHLPSHSHHA